MTSQPRQLAHDLVSVGTSTGELAAANANRTYLLLQNDSDTDIYIKFGAAAVVGEGIRLNLGGGSLEISGGNGNLDTRVVNAICLSASKDMLVTEA